MSRRIEIELTSARPDGVWTWRAAGAQKPKGTVDNDVLPAGAKVGDVLKVDAEFELEGITVIGLAGVPRARKEAQVLELITNERPFEAVTQTLARRDRGDRGDRRDRGDRGDRPRRDRPAGDRPDRPRGDRPDRPRGDRPVGERGDRPRGDRPDRPFADRGDRPRGDRPDRPRRDRPRFEPVPELPQRPRLKRLRPGRAHRNAVLAELPEAQRAIADKALQGGIPAVRAAVQEQNVSLRAEGKEEIPAAGLLKMAEELLPRLRVAEWLDKADAARADIADLDLRDLRSVVAGADDPMVARDENTRELATELKAALISRQDQASTEWIEDINMAIDIGRSIRALKMSSEPPKAGMRFPADLGAKLAAAATASLATDALPERWSAVLEALAFSPVRSQVQPAAAPTTVNDELLATVNRLAAAIPQIAALFGITVAPGAPMPKPARITRKPDQARPAAAGGGRPAPPPRPPRPAPTSPASPAAETTPTTPAPESAPVAAAAEAPATAVEEQAAEPVSESPSADIADVAPDDTVAGAAADAAGEAVGEEAGGEAAEEAVTEALGDSADALHADESADIVDANGAEEVAAAVVEEVAPVAESTEADESTEAAATDAVAAPADEPIADNEADTSEPAEG